MRRLALVQTSLETDEFGHALSARDVRSTIVLTGSGVDLAVAAVVKELDWVVIRPSCSGRRCR
jgi:hypothetical protein